MFNYTKEELLAMGVVCGENVHVHRTVMFFNPKAVTIGSNVRIDCYCVITAGDKVCIGNNVHLANGVSLYGGAGIEIEDFAGMSCRSALFTASDDYTGGYLTNPTVPIEFRNVTSGKITLRRHAIIGFGSAVMPGVTLGRGAALGALSMVTRSIPDYTIVAGNPARSLGLRDSSKLAELERAFLQSTM